MSVTSPKHSLKRSRSNPSSYTDVDLPSDNVELIKRFLLYYIYGIFEDNIIKKIADKPERIERTIEEFNNSMNLVCDIFKIPRESNVSKSPKRSKKALLETFQSSLNSRFRELFEKLQPPILKTISQLSKFAPENIYDTASVHYVYMHGGYDLSASADMIQTVPDNVILVFNTPINRLGICTEEEDRNLIIKKLQEPKSRHKILSQIGCVDKHIDKSEFDNATLASKTFMSRALVLYPGQFYYNINLSFNKLKHIDVDFGVYSINETIDNNYSNTNSIKTDLKEEVDKILKSRVHKTEMKFIFVDCCRSLNDEIIKHPDLAEQYAKISNEMYEYEHFMYYFNVAMNSCGVSIESAIPRSLYIKSLSHLDFYSFEFEINKLLKSYPKKIIEAQLHIIFKDIANNFLDLKTKDPTKPTLGDYFNLKKGFANSYNPSANPNPLAINNDNILKSYYQDFLKYLMINNFVRKGDQALMQTIINLSDAYKRLYYSKQKIADVLSSPYDDYEVEDLIEELDLAHQPPHLSNLMILVNFFSYIINMALQISRIIQLPQIFITNHTILLNIDNFLRHIIASPNGTQHAFSIAELDNFNYINYDEIKKANLPGNNLIFLYYYINYTLWNLLIEYLHKNSDFLLPEQVTTLKKSMRSKGAKSRSSLKKILTEKVDLRDAEDIVNELAIYPNTDAKASQAGGSSSAIKKNRRKLNTKKRVR